MKINKTEHDLGNENYLLELDNADRSIVPLLQILFVKGK